MIKSPTRNIIYNVLLFTLNVGTYVASAAAAAAAVVAADLSFLSPSRLMISLAGAWCLCVVWQ